MPERIVDLTMPIRDHFRWQVRRTLKKDLQHGDQFQITNMDWGVHGFTHIDAPCHIVPGGTTTSDMPLAAVVGRATIVDLTHITPDTEITAADLQATGGHIQPGDIALLKTCWDSQVSPDTPEFWTTAPYMSRDAAEWLLSHQIKSAGFDFPQDYPIRQLLDGIEAPMDEYVTHDVLLRSGIYLMEYLCNMGELRGQYTRLVALPLKIPEADGAPARIIALEDD